MSEKIYMDPSNSFIKQLESPVRIWDLEDGIYYVPKGATVYYNGAQGLETTTPNPMPVGFYITLTSTGQTKFWFAPAGASTNQYIYSGQTTATVGTYSRFRSNVDGQPLKEIKDEIRNQISTVDVLFDGQKNSGVISTPSWYAYDYVIFECKNENSEYQDFILLRNKIIGQASYIFNMSTAATQRYVVIKFANEMSLEISKTSNQYITKIFGVQKRYTQA